jgi:hypothetical protein
MLKKISACNAIEIIRDRYLITSLNINLTLCAGSDFHLCGHVLAECYNFISVLFGKFEPTRTKSKTPLKKIHSICNFR